MGAATAGTKLPAAEAWGWQSPCCPWWRGVSLEVFPRHQATRASPEGCNSSSALVPLSGPEPRACYCRCSAALPLACPCPFPVPFPPAAPHTSHPPKEVSPRCPATHPAGPHPGAPICRAGPHSTCSPCLSPCFPPLLPPPHVFATLPSPAASSLLLSAPPGPPHHMQTLPYTHLHIHSCLSLALPAPNPGALQTPPVLRHLPQGHAGPTGIPWGLPEFRGCPWTSKTPLLAAPALQAPGLGTAAACGAGREFVILFPLEWSQASS